MPVAAQLVTAPLRIHAIDYFWHPGASSSNHLAAVHRELAVVSLMRVLSAFGLGSYLNLVLRKVFVANQISLAREQPIPDASRHGHVGVALMCS